MTWDRFKPADLDADDERFKGEAPPRAEEPTEIDCGEPWPGVSNQYALAAMRQRGQLLGLNSPHLGLQGLVERQRLARVQQEYRAIRQQYEQRGLLHLPRG